VGGWVRISDIPVFAQNPIKILSLCIIYLSNIYTGLNAVSMIVVRQTKI
jgi:hypothetical protein